VGAGGPEHVGFDGGGDQIPLPLQDGRDDQPVGLERPGRPEGQDRVALLDGQVQPAEEAVADSVAAAKDDPSPPRTQDQEAAKLPPARPPGAPLPPAAGPGGDQPDQQPVEEGGEPEGKDGGGVHADRAGQQGLAGGWPGPGGVIPGAGEAKQDAEHVDQPDWEVLVVGAEDDGGDLADQPDQPAGGEQQRRHDQPEGVGEILVVAVAVTVMPHWRHLLAGRAPRGAGPGTRCGGWR
jgi:hypothetical protein